MEVGQLMLDMLSDYDYEELMQLEGGTTLYDEYHTMTGVLG
jgi:hypothetical protein